MSEVNPRLVADIGGTHARFALVGALGNTPTQVQTLQTSSFPGIVEAVSHYLESISAPHPSTACIAVACPVAGDDIRLTNNNWAFSVEQARKSLGLKQLRVVNDFKALAAAVPHLRTDECIQIGNGHSIANYPISVLGPGTGLGVATVTVTGSDGGHTVLDGEGGHVGFAPANKRETEILREFVKRYDRVSIERILSGSGLEILHKVLADIDGTAPPEHDTAFIIKQAVDGACPRCRETIDIFCTILGGFAGDVALMTGSRGGVYIGGGIAPRIINILGGSPFRSRFEGKGRMSGFVKDIPTYLITAPNPALKGAVMLLDLSQRPSGCAPE
ncbi:MAG: glucokinase [Rhodospirillaceae bacterium]|nr:glucokinase [Rhodospirillaceae bacterium]